MDKALLNVVILLAVLAFGIFFGVDMAKNGIEQVNGPIGSAKDLTVEKMAAEQQSIVSLPVKVEKAEPVQAVPVVEMKQPLLGKIFDKVGDLLSWLADSLIRGIVGVGRAVFS